MNVQAFLRYQLDAATSRHLLKRVVQFPSIPIDDKQESAVFRRHFPVSVFSSILDEYLQRGQAHKHSTMQQQHKTKEAANSTGNHPLHEPTRRPDYIQRHHLLVQLSGCGLCNPRRGTFDSTPPCRPRTRDRSCSAGAADPAGGRERKKERERERKMSTHASSKPTYKKPPCTSEDQQEKQTSRKRQERERERERELNTEP